MSDEKHPLAEHAEKATEVERAANGPAGMLEGEDLPIGAELREEDVTVGDGLNDREA